MTTSPELSFIGKTARVFYLMVNFIVWIFGLILIAVGGYMIQNLTVYAFVYSTDVSQLAIGCYLLIGLGCLVFLVGFNGVWACVRESVPWMKVYFVFMLLITIAGLVSGIISLVSRTEAEKVARANMADLVRNEYGKGGIIDRGYDHIHQGRECCGADGPSDWSDSYFVSLPENANLAVPVSCCRDESQSQCNWGAPGVPDGPGLVFEKGCGDDIAQFQSENMELLGTISLIMVGLETISLILVCCVIGTRPHPGQPEKMENVVEGGEEEEKEEEEKEEEEDKL